LHFIFTFDVCAVWTSFTSFLWTHKRATRMEWTQKEWRIKQDNNLNSNWYSKSFCIYFSSVYFILSPLLISIYLWKSRIRKEKRKKTKKLPSKFLSVKSETVLDMPASQLDTSNLSFSLFSSYQLTKTYKRVFSIFYQKLFFWLKVTFRIIKSDINICFGNEKD
jgi:hypothetical protein